MRRLGFLPLIVILVAFVNSGWCQESKKRKQGISDPLGVLTGSRPSVKLPEHSDPGDGWKIIMKGEQDRRPSSLHRVAITRVEIKFDNEQSIKKFLEVLKETDDRLSQIPDDQVQYDWQRVAQKEQTVRFGVAWYDPEFFAARRDAYKSDMHRAVFADLGINPDSIRVEHIPLQLPTKSNKKSN